ncbi:glycosyltransferase family 2 protein [Marimonas sp. MJW-29]|uniref:Glycosyltransferase family 2 protein n=1 Tax=Sulfitobacter sediminis TaxID=3234186 RepID=A0ABV3RQ20_9RHOB
MRLVLLIGPTGPACTRIRSLCEDHGKALARAGIATPDWNTVRLYAACAGTVDTDMLRHRRGLDAPLVAQALMAEWQELLSDALPQLNADCLLLCAPHLGQLIHDAGARDRLQALLAPHFDDIHLVAHIGEQARMLAQHYGAAVMSGRTAPLDAELALAGHKDWWHGALSARGAAEPFHGVFNEVEHPPFWLDYAAFLRFWEEGFGAGHVLLRPLDPDHLHGPDAIAEICALLDIGNTFGPADPAPAPQAEPAASLARMRQFNEVLIRFSRARKLIIPPEVWTGAHRYMRIPGEPIPPGSLSPVSKRFKKDNAALVRRFPALKAVLQPDAPLPDWKEADPTLGFRATQYFAANLPAIRKYATPIAEKEAEARKHEAAAEKFEDIIPDEPEAAAPEQPSLLDRVKVNHQMILSSRFRPHNNLGAVNEEELAAAFAPASPRWLDAGTTGNVIVACMKNEAPYILEWFAYHRAIGVDNFLIYTNDCEDGTDTLLDRLDAMGLVTHRRNDNWKGNSPQQHALNRAMKEPLLRQAEWIIHIDTDEFINIRTGNGTLADLFAAVPDATNIAMTWRLFGHNGITTLQDAFVIDQFDACAPKFCPKPHTVWGFKTMIRNIGAYEKLSCHRPNKLKAGFEGRVKWVNGSGRDMTRDAAKNGWRSSKANIGYDLLQLNHYALRSADSFLIKRQRGRALHVDRTIGLNYWVRMDWSDHRDITIKRNIPRLRAEYDRLIQDDALRQAHQVGFDWHREKAAELRATPEFADLLERALQIDLSQTERVAYAMALDTES